MKRTNTENIGGVIMQYLRENGLETPLNEHRLIDAWPEIAGPTVAGYTTGLQIYNQVLFVSIASAALKNELMMRRSELVKRLNAHVGAQVITQIVIR
ncbi:MAG: DUF721 domain-containing protein [Bacteroidaceae bacterium]|nr:DUF721 domain-containing protein [Bacteroidaceae bacterium]